MSELMWQKPGVKIDQRIQRFLAGRDVELDRELIGGVVLVGAYLPFQLIADAAARLLAEETAARERLAAANAELEATRELLAQSTRIAERARIARDLHDLLGHHLTALSLNLEIASHLTEGDARVRVETAQSVTKLLLGDVRGVVGALRAQHGDNEPE